MFDNIFIERNALEVLVEMSEIVVINDNNNFAPSLFWSLCEMVYDHFDASVFFFGSCIP